MAKEKNNTQANATSPKTNNRSSDKKRPTAALAPALSKAPEPICPKAAALATELAAKKVHKSAPRTTGLNGSPFLPNCATDTVYQAVATAKKPLDVKGIIAYFTTNPPEAYKDATKAEKIDGRVRHILKGNGCRYVRCFEKAKDGTYTTVAPDKRLPFPTPKAVVND